MKKKPKEITIGEKIKEVFDKSGMTISQFAEHLHYKRQNINNIFRRKKIDIELLVEISKVLNHNFIEEICKKHGFLQNTPYRISLILEINNMDDKALMINTNCLA